MTKSKRKHILQWYADNYGIPVQTIFRADKRGWPLDKPKELLKKFMNSPGGVKVNLSKLSDFVNGKKKAAPEPSTDEPGEPEDTQNDSDTIDDVDAIYSGLKAELARLQQETNTSYRAYRGEPRPADKIARQKIYLANVGALRQLAKEAPKADREAGNVLARADVESTWSRAFKECKVSLESLGRRLSTNPLFAGLDPVDIEEIVAKEIVTILAHLESGAWLTPDNK